MIFMAKSLVVVGFLQVRAQRLCCVSGRCCKLLKSCLHQLSVIKQKKCELESCGWGETPHCRWGAGLVPRPSQQSLSQNNGSGGETGRHMWEALMEEQRLLRGRR